MGGSGGAAELTTALGNSRRYDVIVAGTMRSLFSREQLEAMGSASRRLVEQRNPELLKQHCSDLTICNIALREARLRVRVVLTLAPDSWAWQRIYSSYRALVSRCYVSTIPAWEPESLSSVAFAFVKVQSRPSAVVHRFSPTDVPLHRACVRRPWA